MFANREKSELSEASDLVEDPLDTRGTDVVTRGLDSVLNNKHAVQVEKNSFEKYLAVFLLRGSSEINDAKIVSNDVLHTLVFDPYLIVDSDDFLSLMKFSLFDLPLPFWLLPLP